LKRNFYQTFPITKSITIRCRIKFCIEWTQFHEREFILKREILTWTSYMDTYIYIYRRKKDPGEIFTKVFPVNKSITIRRRIKFCIEWTHFHGPELLLKREILTWTSYNDTYTCKVEKKDPGEIFTKVFPVNKNITIRCRIKFCIEWTHFHGPELLFIKLIFSWC
jgi:hypothetical protein